MTAKRDRLSNYAEVVDKQTPEIKAWSQDDGLWKICRENQPYVEASFRTTRERKEDWSGIKAFRIETRQYVTFTVRGGYGQGEFITEEHYFWGGEVATLRKVLEMFKTGHLFTIATMGIEDALRGKATDLQLITAGDIYDWQYDQLTEFERRWKRFRQYLELHESQQS